MLIPIAAILFITVIAMVLMIFGKNEYTNVIEKGVSVNSTNVGGMSRSAAKEFLNKKYNEQFKNKKISMAYQNDKYSIDFKSLKAHYDIDTAVNEAFKYDKESNVFSNILTNIGIKKSNYNVDLKFMADTSIVDRVIKKVARKIDYDPVDASISYKNNMFSITKEESGLAVNKKELEKLIKESVNPDGDEREIQIPVEEVTAKIKAEDLSKIDTEIATFTTSFRTSDAARSGNIRIAATAVDGTVIMPGEIFSMNKEVGPRVASKGYKEAHVIINGVLTTGMAGGICQATTTIYNAALLANFPIISRRGHALRVAYVKPGMDATISGDYIDMRFKNTNKYPIFIHTIVGGGKITAKIYGANEHPGQYVVIDSHVLQTMDPPKPEYVFDPTLPKGEKVVDNKSSEGMKSETYRRVYQDGKLIKNELLSKDKYKAGRAKIRVGTKV